MKASRFNQWMKDLGPIGIGVYLTLTALVYVAAMLLGAEGLKRFGFDLPAGASTASVLGIGWMASKVLQPVRIGATVVITPLLAKLLRRNRPPEPEDGEAGALPKDERPAS